MKGKDVDDYRRENRKCQGYVPIRQKKHRPDHLKREDESEVMCETNRAPMNCPATPLGGGSGMKCRKPFRPKTRKITPARYRATVDAVFITDLLC